ncbi:MAG: response regulator [Candidatus Omnitrophota bacterium]|nr:response regulator [Candidatus Omnitrophota bacterium]
MSEKTKLTKILLVEDNPDDILIIERALKEAKIINQLFITRDGQEGRDFLKRQGKYSDPASSPQPGLILLDINLPKLNGLELLKLIKEDSDLKRIPTVMLTVSRRDEDIIKGYDHGCNSFIQKPVEFEKFVETVRQIGLYWGIINVESPNNVNNSIE